MHLIGFIGTAQRLLNGEFTNYWTRGEDERTRLKRAMRRELKDEAAKGYTRCRWLYSLPDGVQRAAV